MNRIMTLFASFVLSCLMGVQMFAQGGYTVKGVVVDQLGPVIGATIMEQGTDNGTSTGLDGDYTLTVSSRDAVVEISCIGYATQTFAASQMPATITLSEDAMFLDDVVVSGYGSQKKKEVTGSVASGSRSQHHQDHKRPYKHRIRHPDPWFLDTRQGCRYISSLHRGRSACKQHRQHCTG